MTIPNPDGKPDGEPRHMMTIEQVAEYHGVSVGRAYALMSQHGVSATKGFPAEQAKNIPRGRGARSGLARRAETESQEKP